MDASEPELLPEARVALYETLGHRELRDKRLLVLANKQDLPGALGPEEIAERLDLDGLSWNQWYVQVSTGTPGKNILTDPEPTCCLTGEGFEGGLDWLFSPFHTVEKSKPDAVEVNVD